MAVGLLALVEPLLVEAAKRVLIILGGAAAGGVVVEETQKRREEAEETKDEPISKAETKTGRCCKKCPADEGSMEPVKHHMSERSAEYQAKITGFPIGMEWIFKGRDFDGFQSKLCNLQEAKADYDQFFNKEGKVKWFFGGFKKMEEQAVAQTEIVFENPPTSLTYYFQTPKAYELMRPFLSRLGIIVQLAP